MDTCRKTRLVNTPWCLCVQLHLVSFPPTLVRLASSFSRHGLAAYLAPFDRPPLATLAARGPLVPFCKLPTEEKIVDRKPQDTSSFHRHLSKNLHLEQ